MAGELTHIIPTHPSDPAYKARQTRQIVYVDPNGTQHNIIAVYWSPTNNVNDRKLIWQLNNYVPYDDTCTATIVLSQNNTAWIVTIEKDGENVTSSLDNMITWIYNGKGERLQPHYAYSDTIDLSQFPRGDYRLDLSRITSKAGGYFPGSGSLLATDHIYIGNLVAGDKLVAIEYVPTNDITVNSIEIYTTSNQGDNNNARVRIMHESGVYVGALNSDNGPDAANIYHLSGYKRYVNNTSISLIGGNRYYVVYNHDDASPGQNTYWPAYFQNENGNYKEYYNVTDSVTVVDLSDAGRCVDIITDYDTQKARIFALDTHQSFYYRGNDRGSMNPPLYDYYFYKRKSKSYTPTVTVDVTSGTDTEKLAKLLGNLKTNNSITQYGYLTNATDRSGMVVVMQSNYISCVDLDQSGNPILLTEAPATKTTNGVYYIKRNATGLNGSLEDVIAVWDGNNWTAPYNYWYVDGKSLDNVLNYIDLWSTDFEQITTIDVKNDNSKKDDNLRTTALSTTRKYYLKINGLEV